MSLHGMGHFVVAVEFTPGGARYDYYCQFEDVTVGDQVVVKTSRGPQTVTVAEIKPDSEKATQNIVRKVERKGDPF